MMYKLPVFLLFFTTTPFLSPMPMADVPGVTPTQPAPAALSTELPVTPLPTTTVAQPSVPPAPQQPATLPTLPVAQPAPLPMLPIQQIPAPTTPVATQVTPQAQNSQASSQDQIVAEMKRTIETITQTKKEIKTSLNELDDKLLEARKIASEGKNMSLSLLQHNDPAAAQAEFTKVQDKLKSLKDTESFVSGSFTQDFNKKISNFNVAVSRLQAFSQTLRTLVPAHTETQVATMQQQPSPAPEITIKPDRSFFGMLTDMLSSMIAHVISGLKKIKDWIKPNHQSDESQKKTLNTMQQTQTAQLPTNNVLITQDTIKETINLFDAILKSLENQQLLFLAQFQTLKQLETSTTAELKKNNIIVNFDEYYTAESVTFKKFTAITHTIFTSVFHAFIWMVSNTLDLAKQAYSEYIHPFFNNLSKDVKNKVKDLEHPEDHTTDVKSSSVESPSIATTLPSQPIQQSTTPSSMNTIQKDNENDDDDEE